jgi:hypothetical protein
MFELGLGGSFVGMLQAIYTDDRLVTEVNGEVTRSIFLGRGLRQGCSLSPCLFAIYLIGWGKEIEGSTEGFRVGNVIVSGLLFADDLVLCARTADGLGRLLRLSEKHAKELKLTISEKKSMVISAAGRTWDLHDTEGEIYASLDKVMSYKYLGLETYNTFYRVSTAKQKKCLVAARRYRAACRYISKGGPDSVDLSVCTWRNVAMPAVLFGIESVIFSNSNIMKLESEQARWAKETLGLPASCPNVSAQLLLGVPYIRQLIYSAQLKFFMRLGELPATRYAAQALVEHESGRWESKYLQNIMEIQRELGMVTLPPSVEFVDEIMEEHFENVMKAEVEGKSSVEIEVEGLKRERRRSAREGEEWSWVNRAIMGATGIRYNKDASTWRSECGVDRAMNTNFHCVFECSLTRDARQRTGLTMFFASCAYRGVKPKEAFSRFVLGLDGDGVEVKIGEYMERGRALSTIFKASMNRYKE